MGKTRNEVIELSLAQAAHLIATKEISPVDLVEACLERIAKVNEKITASKPNKSKKKSAGVDKASQGPRQRHEVEIVERGDGKHFFIVVRGFRIYFTLEEMKKLVKICHAAHDASDAKGRLYNWFKRFRSDFLVDGDIGRASNPYLDDLYRKLISTYRVHEDE